MLNLAQVLDLISVDSPLRRWRLSKNLTQEELGALCELSEVSISRYEMGRRTPRGKELRCLRRVTKLSLEALIFPQEWLRSHPKFLQIFAEQEQTKRGRPRKPHPPEEP